MSDNVSEQSGTVQTKSLFPAYSAYKSTAPAEPIFSAASTSSVNNSSSVTRDTFGWLKNSSFTSQNAEALQNFTNDGSAAGKIDDDEDENERTDPPADITVIYDQITAKHRSKHKKKSKHKSKRSSKRIKSPSPEHSIPERDSGKNIFIEDIRLNPEHAYRIDRTGDRNIRVFGAFAPNQIPKYARAMRDILVTGKSSSFHQFDDFLGGQSSKKRRKKNDKSFQRYHQCANLWRDETDVLNLSTLPRSNFPTDTCQRLYVPIDSKNNNDVTKPLDAPHVIDTIDTNPLGIYDQNTNLYFQGKAGVTAATVTTDKGENSISICGPHRETQDQYLTRTTVDFNRRLRENPHDVRGWLDFVEFQHETAQVNQFGSATAIGAATPIGGQKKLAESALLEKQLAILDRALNSNPASVELLVVKFHLCRDIWEADKLAREWKRVVFVHPNNTWLWRQYLRFYQTTFSLFKMTKYSALYAKCFRTLRTIHSGSFQTHKPLPRMEEDMIEIFANYCSLLLQTGYHERAIASYQALIEYNFFAPETLTPTTPVENWMAFFEPFWDSGKPRFGDTGAKGWSNTMKERHSCQNITPTDIGTESSETDESVIRPDLSRTNNWLQLEQSRVRRQWRPWRPDGAGIQQEDECDDPDRMVLFDDVEPSLIRLQKSSNQFSLILRFLGLLGVRSQPHLAAQCRRRGCHDVRFVDGLSQVIDERDWRLFRWNFHRCERVGQVFDIDSQCHRSNSFIDEVFRQSLSLFVNQPLQRVALLKLWVLHRCSTWESMDDKSTRSQLRDVKRLVKSFLKEPANRNNLDLWCTYAYLEWVGRNREEARKVFDVALATHGSNESERSVVVHMFAIYAQLELGVGFDRHTDVGVATETWSDVRCRVACLLSRLVIDDSTATTSIVQQLPTPTILKVKHQYQIKMDAILTGSDNSTWTMTDDDNECFDDCGLIVSWTTCYALFSYVTGGLAVAEAVFAATLARFETGEILSGGMSESGTVELTKHRNDTDHEQVYMHLVQLHVLHSNNEPSSSIANIRRVLQSALKRFPENEHFNRLFLDIEAKSHIAGRLRSHYNHCLREGVTSGHTSALFSVLAELERQNNMVAAITNLPAEYAVLVPTVSNDTGITNRLRSLFTNIVNHKDLENCVLVWRLYMKFESMQKKGNGAKSIFYRAIRQCPAAKILYMDAIEYFPGDAQEIHDILTEKEIRVRIPLEEVDLLLEMDTGSANLPDPDRN